MGLFSSIGRGIGGLVKKVAGPALGLIPGGNIIRAGGSLAGGLLGRGSSSSAPTIPAMPRLASTGSGGAPPRVPQGGAMGTIRRVLPGGRSGYTYDPYDLNTPTDRSGRPVAVHMEVRERIHCAPGYVGVDLDGDGVKDACVLKGVARAMGLYKSRPKPLVSGYETRALTVAANVKGRVATVARKAGLYVAAKRPTTTSGGKKK